VNVFRGMETLTLRRLCWRAPRTVMCVIAIERVYWLRMHIVDREDARAKL